MTAAHATGDRCRQVTLLIGPLIRAVPWLPLLAASGLSLLALLPALLGAAAPAAPVWGLRIAAVLLGAGASFAMADTMASLAIVTATPKWVRQWLRLTIALIPATLAWIALFLLADGPSLPAAGLVSEALTCALTAVAGTALVNHALAGPTFLAALLAATLFLPGRWSAWSLPGSPNWSDIHLAWWAAVPVLCALLLAANREP